MPKKRNSIAINIGEYDIGLVFRNHLFNDRIPSIHLYVYKKKLCCGILRFYQKNNRYVLIEEETAYVGVELDQFTKRNTKFKNLLTKINIIESVEDKLCLKNEILLQLM